jgi:glycosyltransferase involved in cell wall biosynthesis
MKRCKTAYVFWGKRPGGRRLEGCKAIGADFYRLKKSRFHPYGEVVRSFFLAMKISLKKRYNVMFVDSMIAMECAFFFKKIFNQKAKAILLVVEPCFASYIMNNPIRRWMYLKLAGSADGIVIPSDLNRRLVKKYLPNMPLGFSPSFIYKEIEEFYRIKPDLKNKKMVFIGSNRPEKGIDLLVKAYSGLVRKMKLPKLYLVGSNMDEFKGGPKGIEIVGEADCTKYLSKATYLIHPARYDSAPTVLMEAMAAGIIPIASKNCGNYHLVEKLHPRLLLDDIHPKTIAAKIKEMQALPEKELATLSKKGREMSKEFTKEKGVKMFKDAYYGLLRKWHIKC